jgi:hypothetical protein
MRTCDPFLMVVATYSASRGRKIETRCHSVFEAHSSCAFFHERCVATERTVNFEPLFRARGELAVVEVDGFHLERSVWLVRRRAIQSPAAKAFVQTAMAFGENVSRAGPAVQLKSLPLSLLDIPHRDRVVSVKRRA